MIKTITILRRYHQEQIRLTVQAICLKHLAISVEPGSRQLGEIYFCISHIKTGLSIPWMSKNKKLTIELAKTLDSDCDWNIRDPIQLAIQNKDFALRIVHYFAERDEDDEVPFLRSENFQLSRYLWKQRKKKLKILGGKPLDNGGIFEGMLIDLSNSWVQVLREAVLWERRYKDAIKWS